VHHLLSLLLAFETPLGHNWTHFMVRHRQCAQAYHKQLRWQYNRLCQAKHNVAGISPVGHAPCHKQTPYCKMTLIVSPKQMMLEAALLLQVQPAVVCSPLLLPAAESSPGQAVVLMSHCSVELGSLVPAHMHECLPALPAAPQHVVLVHHSCMSLHVPAFVHKTWTPG